MIEEEIRVDKCGCMVKRENGIIVLTKTCKQHREEQVQRMLDGNTPW